MKRKVGVIGMGRIGTKVSDMLHKGFGCEVLYCGPHEKSLVDGSYQFMCNKEQLL